MSIRTVLILMLLWANPAMAATITRKALRCGWPAEVSKQA